MGKIGLEIPKTILEPFQSRAKQETYDLIKNGCKRICFVLPGGGGKTVMMSEFTYDLINDLEVFYQSINPQYRDVAVLVHRQELLDHYRNELNDGYGLFSHRIDAETKNIPQGVRSFACMVETFDRRSNDPSFLSNFKNVGLLLTDEAHLNHFKKVFKHFPKERISIGFTATPISAVKSDPLINHYDEIVVGATIQELIELNERKPNRGIVTCQGFDYNLGDVDLSKVRKSKGDYAESELSTIFSADRQIDNTIDAYEKFCVPRGLKTLIFNCDVEHSVKMHEALLKRGHVSQHIHTGKVNTDKVDAKYNYNGGKAHREFLLGRGSKKGWADTYNGGACAINNVGIATIGTDIKSIQCVIINRSTDSFTYFWQMVYRGDRAFVWPDGSIKTHFYLLDMGNNILFSDGSIHHGRFETPIDWKFIFHNPNLPRPGVGAIKSCPECGAINPASASCCSALVDDWISGEEVECGYLFPTNDNELVVDDLSIREMVKIDNFLKDSIDIRENIKYFIEKEGRPAARVFYETIKQVCNIYKKQLTNGGFFYMIGQKEFELLANVCVAKAKEFFHEMKIGHYMNYKLTIKKELWYYLPTIGFVFNGITVDIKEIEEKLSRTYLKLT